MKRNLLILAIILLIGFIVNSCEDPKKEPEPQSKTFYNITTEDGIVNVTVNYTALPGTTPGYMSNLEAALRVRFPYFPGTGNLTINVTPDSNSGFTKTSSKTLSVGESWLLANNTSQGIGGGMVPLIDTWVAMEKKQNRIRYASGMLLYELVNLKEHDCIFG